MAIQEFINTYFLQPLMQNDAGYNIYNTPVYGIILAIAVFLIYKLLRKLKIPIDRNFFIATLPFIFLGGLLRVLRDAEILKNWIYVAPILYFVVFALTFIILIASFFSAKYFKIDYWKIMSAFGWVILIIFGLAYRFNKPVILLQILTLTLISIVIIYILGKFKPEIFSQLNQFILNGAMFDAFSTFVGVAIYGYGEKHVLPNFLFGIFGAWIMLPLKFFVVLIALYVIDKYEKDEFFRNFVKFAILTITLGPGTRNTLRMVMGV